MNFKKNIIYILLFGLSILLFRIELIFHLSKNNIFMMLLIGYLIFIIIVIPYQIRKGNLVNHKMETQKIIAETNYLKKEAQKKYWKR